MIVKIINWALPIMPDQRGGCSRVPLFLSSCGGLSTHLQNSQQLHTPNQTLCTNLRVNWFYRMNLVYLRISRTQHGMLFCYASGAEWFCLYLKLGQLNWNPNGNLAQVPPATHGLDHTPVAIARSAPVLGPTHDLSSILTNVCDSRTVLLKCINFII